MNRARAWALLAVASGAIWPRVASADVLDKIETSHTQPRPSSSSPSTSSSSSSSSTSSTSESSSSEGDFTVTCLVPGPWTGYCIYGARWLRADRSERAQSLAPLARSEEDVVEHRNARRYGEVAASGFGALNHSVYGFDLAARAWFGLVGLDASWLRLQEPGSATLPHLDLLRGSLAGVLVAEKFVEAHLLLGVDALHGHSWTPAFGPGVEVRVYPTPRFNVIGTFRSSIFFEAGDPLFDSRIEAGVTLGRLDARLGGRWIYQADAAGIIGPTASVLIRLGP